MKVPPPAVDCGPSLTPPFPTRHDASLGTYGPPSSPVGSGMHVAEVGPVAVLRFITVAAAEPRVVVADPRDRGLVKDVDVAVWRSRRVDTARQSPPPPA